MSSYDHNSVDSSIDHPSLPPRCTTAARPTSEPFPLAALKQAPASPSSHHIRPRPGRRRSQQASSPTPVSRSLHLSSSIFSVWLLLCCFCTVAAAAERPNRQEGYLLGSTLDKLARRGEILVDRSPPPAMADIQRRQGSPFQSSGSGSTRSTVTLSTSGARQAPAASSSSGAETTLTASPSSSTAAATSSSPTSTSDATPLPPPSPFDTSLGNNFTTSSCPQYFQMFLGAADFKACLPFSLLLQNSNSFFQAEKSLVTVSQALDATCAANVTSCKDVMQTYARGLRADTGCGADFGLQNPLVLQAYNGFTAYEPLYYAGCLKSTSNGNNYCFANAVTNTSSPTDPYVYYLPLGISLPGGSRPTCDECLVNTMHIFQQAAGNSSQPASGTYVPAAQQIDLSCGPTFVNTSVPLINGASTLFSQATILTTSLTVIVTVLLGFVL